MDSVSFTIEGPDGSDDVELPAGLIDLLSEEEDESSAQVVGDIAVMAFTSRAHAIAHHSDGEPSDEIQSLESEMLDAFEDRFGMTYGEATGHQH
ncbi:DUF7545 family protein [Salarchaeum japonicum]|uniref:Uncharacterized protein n=1 Tax=Salarchaeum japonicum TaxID=555573 RepID=A0AAV3SYI8_9EURY|nr:hypothetical protein [Salarchaeum japonicum]